MGQGVKGHGSRALGSCLGGLGGSLGGSGALLEGSWMLVGGLWALLGGSWGSLGSSGALLGGSWMLVGTKRSQRRGENEQEKTKRKNELRLGHPKIGKRGGKEVKLMEKWDRDRRKTHAHPRSHAGTTRHQTKRINVPHQSLYVEEVVF